MTDQKVQRKLAAILYADVADYSRMTGEDELRTHRKLGEHLDFLTNSIQAHDGRVVHFAGDAILAEFSSVVDAVTAAVEAQRIIGENNEQEPEGRKLQFRIGINLGEVIVDRDDIFGDGVNVAARLESLARPGGICISGVVHRQVTGKLPIGFEDMGPQEVKNIAEPIDTYHLLLDETDAGVLRTAKRSPKKRPVWAPIAAGTGALMVTAIAVGIWQFATTPGRSVTPPVSQAAVNPNTSKKPSVAILPFTNLSENDEYGHLADGIAEDVITQLSQVPGLSVISRNSTFTYKGKSISPKAVSEKLGARYVLEGSFRKSGDQVRVSARLIDAPTNLTLWAEKLDRTLKDVFMLQDEIANAIVQNLAQNLSNAERLRGSQKRTANIEAYDYVLQARRLGFTPGPGSAKQAKQLLEKAIELDPEYSQAYAALAWVNARESRQGPADKRQAALDAALINAEKAYDLNDNDYFSHWTLGVVHSHLQNADKATANFQKALELNPNAAEVYTHMVRAHLRQGKPRDAIEAARTAIRLNPVHPPRYEVALGIAFFGAGRLDDARQAFEEAIEKKVSAPIAYVSLAAVQAKLGFQDELTRTIGEIIEKYPRVRVASLRRILSYLPPEDIQFYQQALKRAGLPDGPPPGAKGKSRKS